MKGRVLTLAVVRQSLLTIRPAKLAVRVLSCVRYLVSNLRFYVLILSCNSNLIRIYQPPATHVEPRSITQCKKDLGYIPQYTERFSSEFGLKPARAAGSKAMRPAIEAQSRVEGMANYFWHLIHLYRGMLV